MIMAMSDYLITSNNAYIDLEEFIDSFALEAELINEAKCFLINYHYLEDMNLSSGTAYFYQNGSNYNVEYAGLRFYIETNDQMITNYNVE